MRQLILQFRASGSNRLPAAALTLAGLLLAASGGLLAASGCATATHVDFQPVDLRAPTHDAALAAAKRALARQYSGVHANRRGTLVEADPLYVDFGDTELDALDTALRKPDEVTQALGRVRRTPAIRIVSQDGGTFGFEIKVEREAEELETGYIAYETPYDLHEASSMPTDPTRYGATKAPPRAEWVVEGNDVLYEGTLRQALAEELKR